MLKKFISKATEIKNAAKVGIASLMLSAMTLPVYAVKVKDNLDPKVIMGNIISYFLSLLVLVGGVLVIWGGAQFALENPTR